MERTLSRSTRLGIAANLVGAGWLFHLASLEDEDWKRIREAIPKADEEHRAFRSV